MVREGDLLELKIDDLAYGGDGVGHLPRGKAVFVTGGIPGETVKIRITVNKDNYARGEMLQDLKSVPARVKPRCPVYKDCGGCQLQHIEYEQQLKFKRKMVADALQRIGKLHDFKVKEVLPVDFPWLYRNRAQYPLIKMESGEIGAGFYRKGTHQVVNTDNCEIQHPLINRIIREILQELNNYQLSVYNERIDRGLLRHLTVRVGACTGQALLTIVTRYKDFKPGKEIGDRLMAKIPELTGVLQNINREKTNVIRGDEELCLQGQTQISEYIGNVKYVISPASFFQINTPQTEKMYRKIAELADLNGEQTVIDCFTGLGSIALFLSRQAGKVVGVEEVPAAVEDARLNARINNIDNCTFICGQVEEYLPLLQKKGLNPDIVIVDPPRRGLQEETVAAIKKLGVDKFIYVSCNPATLARDLKQITTDYDLQQVQPVDMFPQTYHIENITLLTGK